MMRPNYKFGSTSKKKKKRLVLNIPRKQHCFEIVILQLGLIIYL
jgi:hypothetical protein